MVVNVWDGMGRDGKPVKSSWLLYDAIVSSYAGIKFRIPQHRYVTPESHPSSELDSTNR